MDEEYFDREEDYEPEEYYIEEEMTAPVEIETVAQADFDAFKASAENKFAELQAKIEAAPDIPLGSVAGYISVAAVSMALVAIMLCIVLCKENSSRIDKMRENHSNQFRDADKKISELRNKIADLERRISEIKTAQEEKIIVKTFEPPPNKKIINFVPPEKANKFDDFVNEFNALLSLSGQDADSRRAFNDFIQKFKVRAFNCTNAEMRIDEPIPPPKFEEVTPVRSGNYWAFEFEAGTFAVVPKIKNYNNNIHFQQAMGEIFKSNFNAGDSYNGIFIDKPAIFKGEWILHTKGSLILT